MPLSNPTIKVQRTIARNVIDKGDFFLVSFAHGEPMTLQTDLGRDQLLKVRDQLHRLVRALTKEGVA